MLRNEGRLLPLPRPGRKIALIGPLAAGERRTVGFTLTRADLSFTGRDLKPTTGRGAFRLWVAPSTDAEGLAGVFTLA